MTTTTVNLKDTTDVVGWIAANVAMVIANDNIPGHDIDTVMERMTTDAALSAIRAAYVFRCNRGDDRAESVKLIGLRVLVEYYNTFDL